MQETITYELVDATENDCDLLFEWANDEVVRLNSFNSNPIEYENHVKWFKEKIKSKDSYIYIFKINGNCVGSMRLDKIEDDTYLLNYSIAKEHRKKGYATILLRVIKEEKKSSLLIGKVKKGNIGSIKSFIKAGYIIKEEQDMYVFYSISRKSF